MALCLCDTLAKSTAIKKKQFIHKNAPFVCALCTKKIPGPYLSEGI